MDKVDTSFLKNQHFINAENYKEAKEYDLAIIEYEKCLVQYPSEDMLLRFIDRVKRLGGKKHDVSYLDKPFNGAVFTPEDYEILSSSFSDANHSFIKNQREKIQNKLLSMLPYILKYCRDNSFDLHPHWNEKYITSLLYPCKYNNFNVNWIGVRLGKTKHEIDQFSLPGKYHSENEYGFQRHGCFQYTLYNESFWVGIFHAIPINAIDRYYLKQELIKQNFKDELRKIFYSISDKGYYFNIGENSYNLSSSNKNDVIEYYKTHDKDGVYCTIGMNILPNDDRLKKENIISTINKTISELYPLFCKIVKRYY
jgi:hypothetical protein